LNKKNLSVEEQKKASKRGERKPGKSQTPISHSEVPHCLKAKDSSKKNFPKNPVGRPEKTHEKEVKKRRGKGNRVGGIRNWMVGGRKTSVFG